MVNMVRRGRQPSPQPSSSEDVTDDSLSEESKEEEQNEPFQLNLDNHDLAILYGEEEDAVLSRPAVINIESDESGLENPGGDEEEKPFEEIPEGASEGPEGGEYIVYNLDEERRLDWATVRGLKNNLVTNPLEVKPAPETPSLLYEHFVREIIVEPAKEAVCPYPLDPIRERELDYLSGSLEWLFPHPHKHLNTHSPPDDKTPADPASFSRNAQASQQRSASCWRKVG
ncbi:hypothetical protein QJS10_CPA03g01310 [Acorus calamus]|uniref:Uncharacterized protein n=1 Tax=Acorus calamus TaxID=4465 RepID=A0AAV9F8A3_ACOCL|nr:hypothetical protein QJS10_CPA03g01310 [Acorus calamus]